MMLPLAYARASAVLTRREAQADEDQSKFTRDRRSADPHLDRDGASRLCRAATDAAV